MKKVLIVDDDLGLAELISDFCQSAGFETRVVSDSLQAFVTAKSWQPHLITLDLAMPGVSGIDVLRQLQYHEDTAKIPVVIISVFAKGALEEGTLQGARYVFEKPLSFHRLLERLEEILSGSVPQEQVEQPVYEAYSRLLD